MSEGNGQTFEKKLQSKSYTNTRVFQSTPKSGVLTQFQLQHKLNLGIYKMKVGESKCKVGGACHAYFSCVGAATTADLSILGSS